MSNGHVDEIFSTRLIVQGFLVPIPNKNPLRVTSIYPSTELFMSRWGRLPQDALKMFMGIDEVIISFSVGSIRVGFGSWVFPTYSTPFITDGVGMDQRFMLYCIWTFSWK